MRNPSDPDRNAAIAAEADEGPFRFFRYTKVLDSSALSIPLPGNLATHFGLEDAQGYIVQSSLRYFAFIRAIQDDPRIASGVWVLPLCREESLASPLLDLLGVRYLLATCPLPAGSGLVPIPLKGRGRDDETRAGPVRVYRNPEAFPRAFLASRALFRPVCDEGALDALAREMALGIAQGADPRTTVLLEGEPLEVSVGDGATPRARVVYPRPDEARITFDGPVHGGWLVLTDAWYPGWKARVDGDPVPVYPADVAFRAVPVPEGAEEVVFRYEPPEVLAGMAISAFVALLLAVCAGWFARNRPMSSATKIATQREEETRNRSGS